MVKHQPAAARRRQILDAALCCFAERGFHGARMEDIASTASLSKGAVYHHFRNKSQVFAALFDDYREQFDRVLSELNEGSPAERIFQYGTYVLEALTRDRQLIPAWIEFFSQPDARVQMATVYRQARSELAQMLRLADEAEAEAKAGLIIATVEGLILQAMTDRNFNAVSVWRSNAMALVEGCAGNPRTP